MAPGAGVLAGTAWIDADGDGIRDVGEPAVAGLTVTVRDDRGNPLQTAVTGEQGEFRFAGLADGGYRVEVGVPTGYTVTVADREVGVPVGVDPDDVDSDVVLDGTGTLAATPLVVLGGVAHDVGIGLVAAPPSEPPTSTTGPAPTSVEPVDTTTAEDTAPPSSAPTTTADTTPPSELSTTTVPTATSTSSTPAPTTTPTTAPQSTVSTVPGTT